MKIKFDIKDVEYLENTDLSKYSTMKLKLSDSIKKLNPHAVIVTVLIWLTNVTIVPTSKATLELAGIVKARALLSVLG